MARKSQRRRDLDWIRTLTVFLVFPAHALWLIIFVPGFSYADGTFLSIRVFRILFAILIPWIMPLLFFISGASTYFALGSRSAKEYIAERFKRLMVPLVFGLLVPNVPRIYYSPKYGFLIEKGYSYFFTFLRHDFLAAVYNGGKIRWGHLWFVVYLFLISLIALPLFILLRREAGRRLTSRLARFFERRGAIFPPGLLLVIVHVALKPNWPTRAWERHLYNDWSDLTLFAVCFICGYIISSDERFWQAIERHLKILVVLAVVLMAVVTISWSLITDSGASIVSTYSPRHILSRAIYSFTIWIWVLMLSGLGKRFLSFSSKTLDYFSEASYPSYIIHLSIMTVIGFYLAETRIPPVPHFLILSIATFLATMILYELIIKRTNTTRFLFGMRLRKGRR